VLLRCWWQAGWRRVAWQPWRQHREMVHGEVVLQE
jgi:hypothetical protein